MEIQPGIPFMGPGWKNRPIDEKPKVQVHGASPYRHDRFAHRGDLLTRTAPGRLGLLLAAVILLGIATAAFGHFVLGAYASFGEAVWNAIAHLLDPGQIGDDGTTAERVVGVVQALIGILFLAGTVLIVLSELFDRALRRLDKGDPGISERHHLLVIGMNDTLDDVHRVLTSNPDGTHPPIVVMLPPEQSGSRAAARRALAGYPGRCQVVVADPGDDGYDRVCAGEARRIVILTPDLPPDPADLQVTVLATGLVRHLDQRNGTPPPIDVEIRRGRNLDALWYEGSTDSGTARRRFPPAVDALVNDRNIGSLLSLVALNPHFTGMFLSGEDVLAGPSLVASGDYAGRSFGSARESLEGATLLGLLRGTGPDAAASYLPPDEEQVGPDDRLIVMRDDSRRNGAGSGIDPESIKLTPARSGPLLVLGFSDSAAALLEVLYRAGLDLGRVTVLAPASAVGGRPAARPEVVWIDGDPCDPDEIEHALGRSEPAVLFAAAPPEHESEAVIGAQIASRLTTAPIIVEQRSADRDLLDLTSGGITVISTPALTAGTVALSLTDPALVVARESMVNDPGLVLESLTYTGSRQLPLQDLPGIFSKAGYYPLAVSLSGEDSDGLAPGDHILAMYRI